MNAKPSIGLLARANNRRCFPVELEDRTVYVRSLMHGEINRLGKLDKGLQNGFFLGKALVIEGGTPEIPQNQDEPDADFAERVLKAMEDNDVDSRLIGQLIAAISKVTKYDSEDIAKN